MRLHPAVASVIAASVIAGACGYDGLGTGPLEGEGGAPGRDASANPWLDGSPALDAGGFSVDAALDGGSLVVKPSHVSLPIDETAPDLTNVFNIDTSARAITMYGGLPVPAGLRFVDTDGVTALFVGTWDVDRDVSIVGTKALVVIASKTVTVNAKIDDSAHLETPGPAGHAATEGPGAGASALSTTGAAGDNPGGGGAGFGTAGAKGGAAPFSAAANGGALYGALITDFAGGSGGGRGSPYGGCASGHPSGNGGAGGGALQITAGVSIIVNGAGVIGAAGGGGRGGCANGVTGTMSGGGGGSGGTIFLEAPAITLNGTLSASGGAGGGGALFEPATDGRDGQDGLLSAKPAAGGAGATAFQNGGAGGAAGSAPGQPGGNVVNTGGGGGAVGRIWLRTRGAPATINGSGVMSPAAQVATDL